MPDLRELTRDEISGMLHELGEPSFRARQVYEWLWKHHAISITAMTSLPESLRKKLSERFTLNRAIEARRQISSDGTHKVLFRLHDQLFAEAVKIPAGERNTACVSSQVGCALGCRFCATGRMGFTRNLSAGEMVDQVTGVISSTGATLELPSNIVFMGMGEPFLNYKALTRAIERITAPDGLGMSPQRITVSSIGIPKMIRQMADDQARYHFALSLHAASDGKRNQIMPFNLSHPLAEVSEALHYYHGKTGQRITMEYVLLGGFNDTRGDVAALAAFCRRFPVKINLIEYNPVPETGFRKSTPDHTQQFIRYLESRNLIVNMRSSKGADIDAACGQLAAKALPGIH